MVQKYLYKQLEEMRLSKDEVNIYIVVFIHKENDKIDLLETSFNNFGSGILTSNHGATGINDFIVSGSCAAVIIQCDVTET